MPMQQLIIEVQKQWNYQQETNYSQIPEYRDAQLKVRNRKRIQAEDDFASIRKMQNSQKRGTEQASKPQLMEHLFAHLLYYIFEVYKMSQWKISRKPGKKGLKFDKFGTVKERHRCTEGGMSSL